MLLLHKHMCTCCSCLKLEFFWYIKVTSIWRTCLKPAWGCVPLEQRQNSSQFVWEAPEQTGWGTRSTGFPAVSRTIALPPLAAHATSIRKGWQHCDMRQGSCWVCSPCLQTEPCHSKADPYRVSCPLWVPPQPTATWSVSASPGEAMFFSTLLLLRQNSKGRSPP